MSFFFLFFFFSFFLFFFLHQTHRDDAAPAAIFIFATSYKNPPLTPSNNVYSYNFCCFSFDLSTAPIPPLFSFNCSISSTSSDHAQNFQGNKSNKFSNSTILMEVVTLIAMSSKCWHTLWVRYGMMRGWMKS